MTRAAHAAALVVALAVLGVGAVACSSSAPTLRPTPVVVAPTATAPGGVVGGATATPPVPPTSAPPPQSPGARSCHPPYAAGPATVTTVFCADPSGMQAARVIRIVDGDTIHVELNGVDETVRFYGIDTTEVGEPCFDEGKERTRELVGSEVRLRADARNRDRYGRLLRYVYRADGLSVDAEMVDEGLAHAWRSDGALRLPIIALEDGARAAHRGCLWQ